MHKIDRLTFLKQNILAYKLQNKCDNNREPGHKLYEVLNVVVPEESHEHPEEDPREHSHHTGRNHHQGQQVGGARALVPEKPDYKNRKRKNSFCSLEPIFLKIHYTKTIHHFREYTCKTAEKKTYSSPRKLLTTRISELRCLYKNINEIKK